MSRVRLLSSIAVLSLLALPLIACGGDDEGGGGGGDAEAGSEVWVSAGCGNCHILAAAESQGTVGPNLDDLQPDAATVTDKVRNGGNGMPSFEGQLSDEDIENVGAYVAEASGG